MVPRISLPNASKPADLDCEGLLDILSSIRDYHPVYLESYSDSDLHTTSPSMDPFSALPDFEVKGQDITLISTRYPSSACSSLPCGTLRGLLSTPSRHFADPLMVSSPTPLRETPTLLYPDFSPQVGLGNTPLEQQFNAHLSSRWNAFDTEVSPVTRRTSPDLFQCPESRVVSPRGKVTPQAINELSHQEANSCQERVSLMDKFLAVAPRPLASCGDFPTFPDLDPQECSSSPISELSALTPLSSPEPSKKGRQLSDTRSTPPTSPTEVPEHAVQWRNTAHANVDTGVQSTQTSSRSDSPAMANGISVGSKRRRTQHPANSDSVTVCSRSKKARISNFDESTLGELDSTLNIPTPRRLPTDIPYHAQFPLFYRRFPVSSYLRDFEDRSFLLDPHLKHPGGIYNPPRGTLDLYTPRYVKGCGTTKVGLCPICIESTSRGGVDQKIWLSMKFSAYKVPSLTLHVFNVRLVSYHMQYGHGISAASARPFSPPVAFRSTKRRNPGKNERTDVLEGKCHKCNKWISVESMKDIEIKVKELYWWKHAAACHQGTQIPGDDDFFEDDEIYRQARLLA